jgi:hypothetical protein
LFDKAFAIWLTGGYWEHRLELLHQPIIWGMFYTPFLVILRMVHDIRVATLSSLHYLYASGHEKMEGNDDYCNHQIGGAPYV